MAAPPSPADLKEKLDHCVKCGMCLPQCPTFRLTRSENRSPRGRLALIEALVDGQLDAADPILHGHLDSCLLCRRCERVCPSGVGYGAIMDAARTSLLPTRPARWYQRLVEDPPRLRAAVLVSRLAPPWLSRPFRALHRQHRLARALYAETPPTPGLYPAIGRRQGRVGLFLGCATYAQQGGALHAATRLLRHAGFDVLVPAEATCCGALAAHTGHVSPAAEMARRTREAYAGQCDVVISVASGCGTHLDSSSDDLGLTHSDVCAFLLEESCLTRLNFGPRHQHVAVHTPCTVENLYQGADWARRLLGLIPELELSTIGEAGQCCGSAGDYLLRHPDTAATLRRPLLDELIDIGAAVLATTNVGCAIHLAAGLAMARHAVEVLHPVELLDRQLIEDTPTRYPERVSTETVSAV
jgi:glycolate oxidase iron-sulfur subunit